ncbi:MAG: Hsp20/alpha crystallin family protein [Burkholderiaceae bacterium]
MVFSLVNRPAALTATRDPFALMDALFDDWAGARAPGNSLVAKARIDVTEKNGGYEVKAELPGVAKEDISIDIEGAAVTIQARRSETKEKKDGERVLYSERTAESFARSFELPQAVDSAAAKAEFVNGVLTLTLPKKEAAKTQRIAVQ